ncbi:NPCBM/NEW2 domain-containing protein [Spirosoma linguale]|uniref:Glycosyl hydrolase family 98 putative carbohydrate binding module n=1 Tax=Spirosoma linguale (strain ATCC 33905 / DSM 74 / LMG 10896 / Claus 1) TaxID=504472 RepID=D2QLP1_SPILD|nr:Glycosyl hydrolase family 98 putative carbohydrate binding module [Spirosoma linguale DSM 74]
MLRKSIGEHRPRARSLLLFYAFLLLFGTVCQSLQAQTTYYVANSGNDANSGNSEGAPFQTLAKVNSLTLQPGDAILFRRGDTFRGSLVIRQSGAPGRPIVIDAYGSGSKPVLAGSVPLTGWSNIGNNIWQANCPSCGSQVTGVYQNTVALPLGRYPNPGEASKGYLTIQSHSGKTQLTSQQGLTANWTGGEAVLRPNQWILDRAAITQQNGNTLTLANNSSYNLADGWGYFIQNHPATLDQVGEWYYNPADKTIQLFDNQRNPNTQLITATTFSEGIKLTNVSYVTVRNVEITETLSSGIAVTGGSNFTFSGNDITNSGEDGVTIIGSGNTVVAENNLIEDANSSGFYIGPYQNFTFRGNTLRRIGTLPGRGKSGDGTYSALQSLCTGNTLIENNVVDNIGYNGIAVVTNATVRYNQVSNFCLTKSDGGGIYTWNGSGGNVGDLHIVSNIVFNGAGAPEGTPGGAYSGANGIFLDDCSKNVEVLNNMSFGSKGMGIFLRGVSSITVRGNTSFNNTEEQLKLAYNGACALRNNIVENNILFSRLANQVVAAYESNTNDLTSYGQFDYNYYVRPFEDLFKIRAVYNPGSGLTGADLPLKAWQAQFGKDANSFNSPITYKSQIVSQTGASLLNSSFSGDAGGWSVWSPAGNGRADWDNTGRLDGGSLRLSFSNNQPDSYLLATVKIGAVTKGKSYQLLFDGVASAEGKKVEVYPRQLSGSYKDLSPRTLLLMGTGRQTYEAVFTATADEANAILVVQVTGDGQTAWIDNVRLADATLTTVNPDDYIKLVYNATSQDKTVGLNGTYRDAKNMAYTNQITLSPFSSAVLMKEINPAPTPVVDLREPENPANAVAGLDYQYYEGYWNNLPDMASLTPVKSGIVARVDLSVRNRSEQYALRYKGYIDIPADGSYTFYTASDDGSKLLIGTTEVVANDGVHGVIEKSGVIGLKAGRHAITLLYFQAGGGQSMTVSYEGPGLSKREVPASAFYRVAADVSGVYLSDLTWTSASSGYGPVEKDRSNGEANAGDGRTITLNGVTYNKGLGVHASSDITYSLNGQYTRFLSDIGIDDEIPNGSCGSVTFEVYLDNVLTYSSVRMNPAMATKTIDLDVSGKQTLRLVVTNAGDDASCDHADWAGARLTGSGSGRIANRNADEFSAELAVQVYPIPARDEVQVRYGTALSGMVSVQLLNTAGIPVIQTRQSVSAGENLIRLSVGELTRGFYVLTVVQDGKRFSRKVILAE